MPRFNGKSLVLGGTEEQNKDFKVDLKTNRNAKMIQVLLRKDVNGMFLFYFYKNSGSMGKGFLMPPGLSENESAGFQREFLLLFERYAELANKKL